jgi:hypothetical protein
MSNPAKEWYLSRLLMFEALIAYGIQYTAYLLEIGLIAYIVLWGHSRRLFGVCLYLFSLVLSDCILRPYTLIHFGLHSKQYYYVYWLSDVVLTLEAFGLICFFFRRALQYEQKLWQHIRMMLFWVFVLVFAISCISLYYNYAHVRFLEEFQQNLYFACLVLNTLLYVQMQSLETQNQRLEFLVCGMGLQFAGPAACLAFSYLTRGHHPGRLFSYVTQLCTAGMFLVWFYAIACVPGGVRPRLHGKKLEHLAVR